MTNSAETAHVRTESVQLRRSPKYGSFMGIGAGLGVVVGVAIAASQPAAGDYSIEQIIGFMALVCGAVGLAIGGILAIVIDRALSKRARTVEAKLTTVEPGQ